MIQSLLALDTSLFLSAQSLVSPEYATIIQILGEAVVVAGGIFLVMLWLTGVRRDDIEYKKNALRIFMGIIGVFVLYSIINLGIPPWRPGAMELSGATALIPHPTDNSFPSGHALFSAALIVGILRYFSKSWLVILFVFLALITTTARVMGGVHYPGDIMGGFLFGGIGAILLSHYILTSDILEKRVYPFFIKVAGWIKL